MQVLVGDQFSKKCALSVSAGCKYCGEYRIFMLQQQMFLVAGMWIPRSWSSWSWCMRVKPPVPKALLEWSLTSPTANSARWGKGAPLSPNCWPRWCAKLVRMWLSLNNQSKGGSCCQLPGLERSVHKFGLCLKITAKLFMHLKPM